MVARKDCPDCGNGYYNRTQMFRAYIRKYDYNGKAKWITKGWICDSCDLHLKDGKGKG